VTQLGAVMEKREVRPSTGASSASGGPRSTATSAPAESSQKKKAARRASGAGAVTGILGVVCALLGVLAAPSLFLPLAVAFSVFALVRSLVAFSFAGMAVATLSCTFTVVGLVLFPWGTYQGSKAATASSSTAAVIQTQNSAAPGKEIQPESPKAAEANASGALSLPSAAPEQTAQPAKPEEGPRPAASAPRPPANSEPQTKLDEALPAPPPPAATVVPDRATPPVAAEPPKPAVAEPPKPVMAEPPKPEVAESPKPIVAPEPLKPATAEPPKAAAAPEPLKPAAEPPKSAAADATNANLQAWPENRTDQTRAIQILLRDLNFYHGTTNGTFGPGTRAAICLYLVTYDEKGECEPTKALFDSLQKRKASPNVGNAPR
jgi:hypothetical protein